MGRPLKGFTSHQAIFDNGEHSTGLYRGDVQVDWTFFYLTRVLRVFQGFWDLLVLMDHL